MASCGVRLFAAILVASALAPPFNALGVDSIKQATRKTREAGSADSIVIPEWKLDLATGNGGWWSKFGSIGKSLRGLWGFNLPEVTSSPAQDRQRCPLLKLPENFIAGAKSRTWFSLSGEWNTPNGVNLATWEQNFLGMAFSRNVSRVGVYIRAASTGEIAVRTRLFSDEDMAMLFNWKPAESSSSKSSTAAAHVSPFNIAIFDCIGTLMYVVKEQGAVEQYAMLYGRDGSLVSKASIGRDILRYQFVDPASNYLIATAEAPGVKANISRNDIPSSVQVDGVLPLGFKFELGGYKNSSALMETEYRWVIAAAVQALTIFKAEVASTPWTVITVVETFVIACCLSAILSVVGIAFCTYRMVYPVGHYSSKEFYGRIAENPFLQVPARPPPRQQAQLADETKSRLYAQDLGLHGRGYGYGSARLT